MNGRHKQNLYSHNPLRVAPDYRNSGMDSQRSLSSWDASSTYFHFQSREEMSLDGLSFVREYTERTGTVKTWTPKLDSLLDPLLDPLLTPFWTPSGLPSGPSTPPLHQYKQYISYLVEFTTACEIFNLFSCIFSSNFCVNFEIER